VPSIEDPDVQVLAGLATTLHADYLSPGDDPWAGSPFAWILSRPSRQKGAIFEQLVAGWCAAKGVDVTRSRKLDADRVIHGYRVEIKGSTLWASRGFKFQQIRDQEYDYLFCLGLAPFTACAWFIPKHVLFEHVIGHMGQHTGATGTDTAWLGFQTGAPYEWMSPFGGTLGAVWSYLGGLEHGPH
jgi:hypothetical protein